MLLSTKVQLTAFMRITTWVIRSDETGNMVTALLQELDKDGSREWKGSSAEGEPIAVAGQKRKDVPFDNPQSHNAVPRRATQKVHGYMSARNGANLYCIVLNREYTLPALQCIILRLHAIGMQAAIVQYIMANHARQPHPPPQTKKRTRKSRSTRKSRNTQSINTRRMNLFVFHSLLSLRDGGGH